MSQDIKDYERNHYTILQLVGDIGALYGTLHSVGLTIIVLVVRVGDATQFEVLNRVFKRKIHHNNKKLFRITGIQLRLRDWLLNLLCHGLRRRIRHSHSFH